MNALRYATLPFTLIAGLGLTDVAAETGARVVTLGGSVTEIAVALGAGGRLVARDTTSNWPESVASLPDVGYIRALSPEGVLSVNPDLILAEGDAGPAETIEALRAASVPFLLMPEATTPAALSAKVRAVGKALDLSREATVLALQIEADLAEVKRRADAVAQKKRVLFVLSLQGGRVLAGGEGTEADGIITLAGGKSVGTGFHGYKQMTDEALIAAAPDVILMMDREGDLAISDADLLSHPALGETPAGKARQIIRMEGMLMLGFGPRTPQAARQLHDALYPAAAKR